MRNGGFSTRFFRLRPRVHGFRDTSRFWVGGVSSRLTLASNRGQRRGLRSSAVMPGHQILLGGEYVSFSFFLNHSYHLLWQDCIPKLGGEADQTFNLHLRGGGRLGPTFRLGTKRETNLQVLADLSPVRSLAEDFRILRNRLVITAKASQGTA